MPSLYFYHQHHILAHYIKRTLRVNVVGVYALLQHRALQLNIAAAARALQPVALPILTTLLITALCLLRAVHGLNTHTYTAAKTLTHFLYQPLSARRQCVL